MRKNKLSNKIAKLRIKHLLREGYTKAELSRGIGLAYKTLENILDPKKEFIRLETHEKIAQFCNNLEEQKTKEQTTDSYFLTSEDIIDSEAAEKEAKEISRWIMWITIIGTIIFIGFILLIRYVINLF